MIRQFVWSALILSLFTYGGLALAEDVEGHPLESCHPGTCFIIYDLPGALENAVASLPIPPIDAKSYGQLKIEGAPGMNQGTSAKAAYCGIQPPANLRASCDLTELSLPLGQAVTVPAGVYILSYSGTQSPPLEVKENELTTASLKKLSLERAFDPESGSRRLTSEFSVSKDLSNAEEQDKFLLGIGALRINREQSLSLCSAAELNADVRSACEAILSSSDAKNLRNALVRFDDSSSWSFYGLNVQSWMHALIWPFLHTIVSEINGESASSISVFPGAYLVSYSAGRSVYLVKKYVIR